MIFGNVLVPILFPHILCSNYILLPDFLPSLPQRLFWNIWYAPCIFGTTVYLDRVRSDRVVVLQARRNGNNSINFKTRTQVPG